MGFLALAAAYPGIIHDETPQLEEKIDHQALIGETGHHHHIEHEHAKSHQSIKFEHFHPVPVYVKKEHSHLLKHPLEKGHNEQQLKLIHPETEHKHGGGLVLEDSRHDTEHYLAGLQHGGFEHGGIEGFAGYEGGEGLKEYGHLQLESHGAYNGEQGFHGFGGADSGEGYKYESY